MNDQWFFEIGDGQTYGPYPLEKLQKWAASGNLMPTHRVRHADSNEWIIAAYVPGLEMTNAARRCRARGRPTTTRPAKPARSATWSAAWAARREPTPSETAPARSRRASRPTSSACATRSWKPRSSAARPTSTSIPRRRSSSCRFRVDGELETLRKLPKALHSAGRQPVQGAGEHGHRRDAASRRTGGSSSPLGPQQAQGEHSRRVPAHDARRAAHAAAVGAGHRAAHAQPARHVEGRPRHVRQVRQPGAGHDPADRPHRQRQDRPRCTRRSAIAWPTTPAASSRSRTRSSTTSSASPSPKSTRPTSCGSTRRCERSCAAIPT